MEPNQKYLGLVMNPPINASIAPRAPRHIAAKYPTPDPNCPVLTHVEEEEKDKVNPNAIINNPNHARIFSNVFISLRLLGNMCLFLASLGGLTIRTFHRPANRGLHTPLVTAARFSLPQHNQGLLPRRFSPNLPPLHKLGLYHR